MDLIHDYDSSFSSSSSSLSLKLEETKENKGHVEEDVLPLHKCETSKIFWHTKIISWEETPVYFQRNQPHITGNWSGHIYLNLDDDDNDEHCTDHSAGVDHISILKEIAVATISQFEKIMKGEEEICDLPCYGGTVDENTDLVIVAHVPIPKLPSEKVFDNILNGDATKHRSKLHVSLSRPFYLQNQSIEPFLKDLQNLIQRSILQPLIVRIPVYVNTQDDSLDIMSTVNYTEILTNDEQTRSFLTLPILQDDPPPPVVGLGETVQQPTTTAVVGLQSLVKLIDSVMVKYGQKVYYQDPKFHISIASWKFNGQIIEKWERQRTQQRNDDDDNVEHDTNSTTTTRLMILTFILRGIHCDFGKVKRYWIPFGT